MAELVGVISSIIAIAGVGMKLSKTLYVTGDKAFNADHYLNRIATNVSLFSLTLKHFATVLDTNPLLVTGEAAETARNLVEECKSVFQDLASLVVMTHPEKSASGDASRLMDGERRRRRFSVIQKLQGWYESPKTQSMLAQLEYLKSTLGLLIQTFILASATLKAKQDMARHEQEVEARIDAETKARLEDEKMHVKTLIIAWQLSVTIVQQAAAKAEAQDAAEDRDARKSGSATIPSGRDSTDSSEASEVMHQGQGLIEPAPSTTSLVSFRNTHSSLMERVLPPTSHPMYSTFTSFDQIIDQMLGRWTKIDEMETEMNRETVDRIGTPRGARSGCLTPPELTLSMVELPEDLGKATTSQSHPLLTMQNTAQEGQSSRAPPGVQQHSTSPNGSTLPPPPRNTKNLRVSSKAPPLSRSVSTPETEAEGGHIHMRSPSPQPTRLNTLAVRPNEENFQMNPYSPRTQAFHRSMQSSVFDPTLSPSGSYNTPSTFPSNYRRPQVSESPEDSCSDLGSSTDEEGRIGLGIEYRIRMGQKYWDIMDGKIIGPRTPLLPPEPLEYLYKFETAHTEIKETWVSEMAMQQSGLSYVCRTVDDEYLQPGWPPGRVWVIDAPLKFPQIEQLVEKTIEMGQRRGNAQPQPNGILKPTGPTAIPQDPRQLNRGPPAQPYYLPRRQASLGGSSVNSNTWAAMERRADQNQGQWQPPPAGTRALSYQEGPPRPGTSGSGGTPSVGGVPRSPRLNVDGGERGVHFSPSVAGSVKNWSNTSRQRERDVQPQGHGRDYHHRHRRTKEMDRYSDDSSDYERRKKEQRKKEQRKEEQTKKSRNHTAKVMGSIAGIAAMLEGLESAF